jgi:hypothetical protein
MNSPGRNNGDPSSSSGGSPHDDGFPAFVVPDDISELDAEVQAYRRECARARRRARLKAVSAAPFHAAARGFHRFAGLFRFLNPW